jgi:hypothetical protein
LSDDAKTLISQFDRLWQQQGNFRALWNVAAQFCMPAWDNFIGEFAEGVNRNTRIFDSTAVIANERFGAAMEAMLTPRSQVWAKFKAEDEDLEDVLPVQQYLDKVNKIVFAARYHPEANFASQTDECYLSLGAYGNMCLFIDEVMGKCLRYRSFPLSEIVWSLNHQGQVDTVFRKFRYTAKQAEQHWGGKASIPPSITRVLATDPYMEFDFLHVIRPNPDHKPFEYGAKNKPYEGWYIYLGDQSVLERGGYRTFPCAVGRYRVAPREHYGRGPATTCLPDVRTANEMVKTGLRAGQKAVDPPILLAEDSILNNFNQRPGANNYGMVSSEGKPLAIPFKTDGNWELADKMLDGTRGVIRDTFLNTLFQILVENPNMTATEALLRAQEKGELIAPAMGRQQSEFLGPLQHREIDILSTAGAMPPAPVELLRSRRGMTIEYTSPLARALRAEEGTAIMNTMSDMATIAQIDPSVKYIIDTHDAVREMANIRGCPAKLVRSEDQVDQLMQNDQQQAQQAAMLQQAPLVSQSVLNLAKASQAAGAQPSGGSPGATDVAAAA